MPYEVIHEDGRFVIHIPGVTPGPHVSYLYLRWPEPFHIEITFAWCPKSHRRQGLATLLMNALMEKADLEGRIVRLDVCGDDNDEFGPTSNQLAKWYGRFSFVPIYNPNYRPSKRMMERQPRKATIIDKISAKLFGNRR
jgi:GNAT superfamily N-acetyltransferase